jgi:hypothetical protein
MSLSKFRPLIAVSCSALVLALPAETEACWLTSCFCHAAPACPAPACPAPVAQQVNYVPQTCYRTVYRPVAVTSYRPITTADPCTGCPVTSLSPVTTYVQRPVVVPYTTYRPVVTTVLLPTAPACPCSSCATGACGVAPATSYYAPAAIAAPSCGCGASTALATGAATTAYYAPATASYSGAATTSYYAPPATSYSGAAATSYYAPAASSAAAATTYYPPSYTTTSPSSVTSGTITTGPITTGTVTTGPITTGSPSTTYYNGVPANVAPGPVYYNPPTNGSAGTSTGVPSLPNNSTNGGSIQVQKPTDVGPPPEAPKQPPPIPDNKEPAKGSSTGILKYEPQGRTTSMPILRPWSYTAVNWPHVSTVSTATPTAPETDADGWHAAR